MLYRLLPLFLKAIAKQSVNVVFSKYILNGCDEITDQPNKHCCCQKKGETCIRI